MTAAKRISEISTLDLARFVWANRWLVAAAATIGGSAALVHALRLPDVYRAEAVIQPQQEQGGGRGLAALLPLQLSEFAAFGSGGDRAVAIATLKSRAVIEPFIEERGLLRKMYPFAWDESAKTWKYQDPNRQPNVWQAYNDFTEGILKVTEDRRTGLYQIAVEWFDAQEARDWLTEIIARTNEHLRAKAIKESTNNLAYLEGQASSTRQVELKSALYALVEAESKKLMLARGGAEFALKTVDAAVVPRHRVRPRRQIIVLVGILSGTFFGMFLAVVRSLVRPGVADRDGAFSG